MYDIFLCFTVRQWLNNPSYLHHRMYGSNIKSCDHSTSQSQSSIGNYYQLTTLHPVRELNTNSIMDEGESLMRDCIWLDVWMPHLVKETTIFIGCDIWMDERVFVADRNCSIEQVPLTHLKCSANTSQYDKTLLFIENDNSYWCSMQFKMKAFRPCCQDNMGVTLCKSETSSAIGLLVAKEIVTSFPPSINLENLVLNSFQYDDRC